MRIIVCVKPVIKLAEKSISRDSSKLSLSNADKSAIAESLKLKASVGAYVTVISMSTPNSANVLELLFLYGVDEIILLTHPCFAGSDTFATAYALGTLIKMLPKYDLVLMGNKSDDSETGQVPPAVACDLNVPYLSNATVSQFGEQNQIYICRKVANCTALYELKMPAVISVAPQMADFSSLTFAELAHQDKHIKKINELTCYKNKVGANGSKTRVVSQYDKSINYIRNVKMIDLLNGSNLIRDMIKGATNE